MKRFFFISIGLLFGCLLPIQTVISEDAEELAESQNNKSISNDSSEQTPNPELTPDLESSKLPLENEEQNETTKVAIPKGPVIGYVPEKSLQSQQYSKIQTSDKATIEAMYQQGITHLAKGNHQLASDIFSKVIKIDEQHLKSRIKFAELLIETGKYKQASNTVSPFCLHDQIEWQACFWNGIAELLDNQFDKAAQAFDMALLVNVDHPMIWLHRALVEQERKDHHVALQLLSIANILEANNPNIILNMAYSNEALGNLETAFNQYKIYLEITSKYKYSDPLRFAILSHISSLTISGR